MVISRAGGSYPQQCRVFIHCLDDGAKKQQELFVAARGRKQVFPVCGHRPVVVLAAAIDAVEGLFMQKADQIVAVRYLFHQLHDDLILIAGTVGQREDRRELMLARRHLIVLRLGGDA